MSRDTAAVPLYHDRSGDTKESYTMLNNSTQNNNNNDILELSRVSSKFNQY